jgi:hypothetical protein
LPDREGGGLPQGIRVSQQGAFEPPPWRHASFPVVPLSNGRSSTGVLQEGSRQGAPRHPATGLERVPGSAEPRDRVS